MWGRDDQSLRIPIAGGNRSRAVEAASRRLVCRVTGLSCQEKAASRRFYAGCPVNGYANRNLPALQFLREIPLDRKSPMPYYMY